MIRINLLPYRAEKRKARNRQFGVMTMLTASLGVVIWFAGHTVLSGRIEHQRARNDYLKKEIAVLDKQIAEIKTLKDQIQALLARKEVVEKLQSNRTEVVHLLDQMVRVVPEGVYFTRLKQSGNVLNLVGYAQSSARVSTLMRNIEDSPWLGEPQLVEIKAEQVGNLRLNQFILNFKLTPPQTPGDERAGSSSGKAKG
ncbi:PilN domain-containing protein [Pelomicrobium methylotrophicum]|uniref:PilN domain-containing protein n=1 Tax=Pelomicrobium methylotrophicum TaxID=2602750 RepID=A0A5C7ER08_9PROT|nr:PilN domain-containing protein [Pelomicrobium methylotrophicum]TXF11015.1 PilN domain-containing protein [Pelomicrobium methylotrophicum]